MKVQVLENQHDVTERDLGALQQQMHDALKTLEDARDEESRARSAATAALNEVNRLQKQIDGALLGLQQIAPQGTDWAHRQK